MSKRALRRFLLEKQKLLEPCQPLPGGGQSLKELAMQTIRELECVQIDPVSAVRPNQHLVLAARIPGYDPAVLNELLRNNEVFEYYANAACVIPMEDYPLFKPVRERMGRQLAAPLAELQAVAKQVLDKLREEGPLPSKAFESGEKVHGYWDNTIAKTKATSHALNLLSDSALIRIVGREGNQRLFDLAERSVPAELLQSAAAFGMEEARDQLLLKYYRAYRVFEPSDARFGWQRMSAAERKGAIASGMESGLLAAVEAEGVKLPYYVLSSDADRLAYHQDQDASLSLPDEETPVSFLPPLDNLLWSRKRLEELFDFEYRWEIYTPAVKRKYGYYAMPILAGDRIIGRIDPRLDQKEKRLNILLLQIEPGTKWTKPLERRVHQALHQFAAVHGAETVTVEKVYQG